MLIITNIPYLVLFKQVIRILYFCNVPVKKYLSVSDHVFISTTPRNKKYKQNLQRQTFYGFILILW